MAIFIRERKAEWDRLAQLLINPDAGEVFRLLMLNMGIESAMEKNNSHGYNQDLYGEWCSHSNKERPRVNDDDRKFYPYSM